MDQTAPVRFCERPARTTRATPELATFGIFTIEAHREHRRHIRSTWLSRAHNATSLAFQFVLMVERDSIVGSEVAQHRDVIFVEGQSTIDPRLGHLTKTWLWLQCAASSWPDAQLIGKVDDDTWLDVIGIERHLRASIVFAASLRSRTSKSQNEPAGIQDPEARQHALYWGLFGAYHWHTEYPGIVSNVDA